MNVKRAHIPERPGCGRLGRHVCHDERSRAFAMAGLTGRLFSVQHKRHCDPFDQGDVGSCTGNAAAGALMTDPVYRGGEAMTEVSAVEIYKLATQLDSIHGTYPPDDTGSSGLAAAKACKKLGYLRAYLHAFGLNQALAGLAMDPLIIGINWYDGFDAPEGTAAELKISGEPRGGHEVVLDGLDVENGYVHGTNSWGLDWGNLGRFVMSFGTFKRLLYEGGDAMRFVR